MSAHRCPRWSGPVAWVAVAVAVLGLGFTHMTSPDLGFHLATGRAVLAVGRIPATNVLSFTEPDHPWILHEWIPAVLFELAWRRSGPAGVLAVKLVIVLLTWLLVHATALRLGASSFAAAIASLLGAGAASIRFSERPQIFSALALAACGLLLADAARAQGSPRARRVLAAGLVAALATQVHAGAITSFALFGAIAAGLALEPLRARLFSDEPRGLGPAPAAYPSAAVRLVAVAAGGVAVAALALALYHPHGARPLLVPFQLGGNADLREHVVEYRSPIAFPFASLHLYWGFAGISATLLLSRVRRLSAATLVPFLAFGALSLRHARTVDAFAIVTAPTLALTFDQVVAARLPRAPALGLFTVALLALGLPVDRWFAVPPGVGLAESVWPTPLFRFVAEQHVAGPAFVSDGWAGPFLGVFYPRERAFFDPRFEAYSPAFVRDVYRSIRYGEPGWEEQLDRYGVQLVLLKYTTPGERAFEGGRENLRQLLAKSARWALVGFGDTGEVFVRREGPNAGIAERFAIPGVEPDEGAFLIEPQRAAAPLLRALDHGFVDNRVIALAAVAVAAAGDRPLALRLLDQADAQRPGDPHVLAARARMDAAQAPPP